MKKILYLLTMLLSVGILSAQEKEQEVLIFETFGDSVVMVYQSLYFDSASVSQPALFKKVEEKYDVKILDRNVTLSSGSGFFITKSGHVITNLHVVDAEDLAKIRKIFYESAMNDFFEKIPASVLSRAESRMLQQDFKRLVDDSKFSYGVLVNNKDNYSLQLVDSDKDLDVAILETLNSPENFRPIFLGDSGEVKVGQSVIAIGYPVPDIFTTKFKDVKSTLTTGSVSAVRSDNWGIQHTASISPGNSGGPLFNKKGEIIGVNVGALTTGNNIFFSIPSNKLKEWLSSKKYKEIVEANAKEAFRLGTIYALTREGYLEIGGSMLVKLPEGYDVYLDGRKRGVTPLFLENLSPGAHKLVIQSAAEYKEEKLMVSAAMTETFIYQPLLEKYSGKLLVETNPSGAVISIKNQKYGVTPNVIDKLPIGGYEVKLSLAGYFSETTTVAIEKNKTSRIGMSLKKAFTVSFKPALPAGATVLATGGGKSVQFQAADKIALYKGDWEIIVSGERFESKTFHVSIIDSDVALDFTPVANFATLIFTNLAKESSVFIDGKDKSADLKENKLEISSGKHNIKVKLKDMYDFDQTVEITPESTTEITIAYTPTKESILAKLRTKVDVAEGSLRGEPNPGISHTLELETIEKEILASETHDRELEKRISVLIVESLKKDETAMLKVIKDDERTRGTRDFVKWTTLGLSAVGTGMTVLSIIMSGAAYENYQNATITADAIRYGQEFQLWDTLTWISGGVAGASAGVSLVIWIGSQDPGKMQRDLSDIRARIQARENI